MYKHQTIEYDKRLPARITLCDSLVDRCRGEPHWHEEIQLIYVDEGSLNMTVGNRKLTLDSGDVQVINPCEVHSLKKSSAKYFSVHFSRVFVQSFFDSAESYGYVLEEGSQERREMVFLMQKLLAVERNTFDEYSALVKYSLLLKMLRLLLTRCRTERLDSVYGTSRSLDDDVIAVKQYIEANYHRKIMTADYENLLHFDATYVMTYFKKQTGMTIMTYTIKERTRHALDDYLTHDIPIGEAAKKNGFCHYNHFTKACHKYYGASPTALKKARRQQPGTVDMPLVRTA